MRTWMVVWPLCATKPAEVSDHGKFFAISLAVDPDLEAAMCAGFVMVVIKHLEVDSLRSPPPAAFDLLPSFYSNLPQFVRVSTELRRIRAETRGCGDFFPRAQFASTSVELGHFCR